MEGYHNLKRKGHKGQSKKCLGDKLDKAGSRPSVNAAGLGAHLKCLYTKARGMGNKQDKLVAEL